MCISKRHSAFTVLTLVVSLPFPSALLAYLHFLSQLFTSVTASDHFDIRSSPGVQWIKVRNAMCQTGPVFSSLVRAQAACSQLGSNCHGVYDVNCNGRALSFSLCKAASFSKSGVAGCVHKLKSTFAPMSGMELRNAIRSS